jgi:hypothetical protein
VIPGDVAHVSYVRGDVFSLDLRDGAVGLVGGQDHEEPDPLVEGAFEVGPGYPAEALNRPEDGRRHLRGRRPS